MSRLLAAFLLAATIAGALLALVASAAGGQVRAASVTCTYDPTDDGIVVEWTEFNELRSGERVVISRRVDNGPVYWRARAVPSNGSYLDELPAEGEVTAYQIQRRSVGGVKSAPIACSLAPQPPNPPTSCTFQRTDGKVQVGFSADDAATSTLVLRSVDGGPVWWRGRVDAPTEAFVDTDRPRQLDYFASSKNDVGLSERIPCVDITEPATPGDPVVNNGTPPPAPTPERERIDVVAVGDMVSCGKEAGPRQVVRVLDQLEGTILGLGDFSQEDGSRQQFTECVDPVIGALKDRIEPIPGNHEYWTEGAAPYFEYFGAAAGDPTKGYTVRTKGNWQILYLNSQCWEVGGCEADAPQQQWLERTLAEAPPGSCRMALIHHPRWSSWGPYASNEGLDPIYSLLYEAGTDLVLTGHAHHYERLVRLDADGRPDPERGLRQITVGTGGTTPRIPDPADVRTTSGVLHTGVWGVLDLDLYDDSYDWRFITVDNDVLDSGSDTCIAAG